MTEFQLPGADPENSERGSQVPHPPLYFSGDAANSIVGIFVMQKLSDINISEGRIKEHFIQKFPGWLEGFGS